ncbi:MAG: hypothetical protein AAFO82_06310 [Bacteroidota bacterium]
MRQFGKTPRLSFWQKVGRFFKGTLFFNGIPSQTHEERMNARRRKTRFDR